MRKIFVMMAVLCLIWPIYAQRQPIEFKQETPFCIFDGINVVYRDTIHIDLFPEDRRLNSIAELINIKISIEHSYAMDLTLELRCPDDQGVKLITKETTPSETILGEPWACGLEISSVDNCTVISNAMGNCYDYFWSPDSDHGLLFDSVNMVSPSWYIEVMDSLRTLSPHLKHPLPGRAYQPLESWDNLLGCTMNGDWELIVTDHHAMDNGWVCNWSLTLDVENELVKPQQLKIENLTSHSAELSWLPVADETGWLLEYKVSGNTDSYRRLYCSVPHRSLTNLIPDTLYDIRIRTVQGDVINNYFSDTTFRTLPGAPDPSVLPDRLVEMKLDGPFEIPDNELRGDSLVWLESTIFIDFFPEGKHFETMEPAMEHIKVSMEHSYPADLFMIVECPGAGEIVLMSGNEELKNSILGEPRACGLDVVPGDDCTHHANSWLMGNCHDYFWAPASYNGPIYHVDNFIYPSWYINALDSVRTEAASGISHPVPGREYRPQNSWNELVNCPMNGEWKLKVLDRYPGNNGWIAGWSITFNVNKDLLLPKALRIEDLTDRSVRLGWSPVADETGWLVEYKIPGTNDPYRQLWCSSPDTVLTDLIADTLYALRIRTIWGNDTNIHFLDTTFNTLEEMPGIDDRELLPKELKIENITDSSVELRWLPAADETGWLVEYKVYGTIDPYRQLYCSSPDTFLTGLIADTLYDLRIRTIRENEINPYSLDTAFRTISIQTGIVAPEFLGMVILYPNPAHTFIAVRSDIRFENVEILDLLGKTIYHVQVEGKAINLDLSSYPAGVYFIRLKTERGLVTKKFIRE